jgi:hypothetical protein
MIKNIVGDPTGFAKTLRRLHSKLPLGDFWAVGDLPDRGPDSKDVFDFFIDNGYRSVMGNHDHMMLWEKIQNSPDVHRRLYTTGCWGWNGGEQTAQSFGFDGTHNFDYKIIDPKYYQFIENMPLLHEDGNLIISHAPINQPKIKKLFELQAINKEPHILDQSVLWNRNDPKKQDGKFQVYGHNSTKGILWHTDRNPLGIYMADPLEVPDGAWAVCIDTWREGYLTALSIDLDLLDDPKKAIKIIQQEVIDPFDFGPRKPKRTMY